MEKYKEIKIPEFYKTTRKYEKNQHIPLTHSALQIILRLLVREENIST